MMSSNYATKLLPPFNATIGQNHQYEIIIVIDDAYLVWQASQLQPGKTATSHMPASPFLFQKGQANNGGLANTYYVSYQREVSLILLYDFISFLAFTVVTF